MAQPHDQVPDTPMSDATQSNPSVPAPAPQTVYQNTLLTTTTQMPTASPIPQFADTSKDIAMTGGSPKRPASPAVPPTASSPQPPRTGTPVRATNGNDATSRAASQHPENGPVIPNEAPPNGAPVRQYLNGKVTGVLLEGMKRIAKEQPKDPLRILGEYLLQRSKEVEGT